MFLLVLLIHQMTWYKNVYFYKLVENRGFMYMCVRLKKLLFMFKKRMIWCIIYISSTI